MSKNMNNNNEVQSLIKAALAKAKEIESSLKTNVSFMVSMTGFIEANQVIDVLLKSAEVGFAKVTEKYEVINMVIRAEALDGTSLKYKFNLGLWSGDCGGRVTNAFYRIMAQTMPPKDPKKGYTEDDLFVQWLVELEQDHSPVEFISLIDTVIKTYKVRATVIGEVTEKKVVTVAGTTVKQYVNPALFTFGYRKPAESGKEEEI